MDVQAKLKSIYYGKGKGNLLSTVNLYKVAKEEIPNLRYQQVRDFLARQTVYLRRKVEAKKRIKGSKRYFNVNRPKYELVVDTASIKRYGGPAPGKP